MVARDISCCYGDRDLIAVCHGSVDEGQYLHKSSLLRMEGGDPDTTDQGTLQHMGDIPSSNAIQK